MFNRTAILAIGLMCLFACQSAGSGSESHEREQASAEQGGDDDCGVEDGTQTATIDYYNPETGYSASYTLDVEVENCQVVQIDFNNGGYLDGDHIQPTDIDEDGDASIEDDQGRSFEVHIQK